MSKCATLQHEPCDMLKHKVTDALKEQSNVVRLKSEHEKGLVDYCGRVPETWARSATRTSVRREFLANAMIDEKIKMCPVWDKTMRTVPRKSS